MPYLNVDLDYFDHRKTKRLIGLLGRGAEVLPLRLWSYCGKFHCEDGRLADYSDQEIESMAGWWGKTGEMLPAMKRAEFMEQDESGAWFMHDWREHQGHIAAFKVKGRLMAQKRWDKARGDAASTATSITGSNTTGPPQQCSNPPTNRPTDQPNQPSIEPPRDDTPSWDQVKTFCSMQMIPENIGKIWFDDHDGRPRSASGKFTDRDGIEVFKWESRLKAYAEKWRANEQQKNQKGGTNANGNTGAKPRTDRNVGTANDGKSGQYRGVEKMGGV